MGEGMGERERRWERGVGYLPPFGVVFKVQNGNEHNRSQSHDATHCYAVRSSQVGGMFELNNNNNCDHHHDIVDFGNVEVTSKKHKQTNKNKKKREREEG